LYLLSCRVDDHADAESTSSPELKKVL